MKEYIKPEVQCIELITEAITDFDGSTGYESGVNFIPGAGDD